MKTWSPGAFLLFALAIVLGILALALRAIWAPLPAAPPGPAPSASASATVAFPSAEPSFDASRPLTSVEVGPGHPVAIDGSGSRQVAYTVTDDSGIHVRIDCSLCSSGVTVVAAGGLVASASGPTQVNELLNLTLPERRTLLIIDTRGRWRLTLISTVDEPLGTPTPRPSATHS